MSTVDLVGYLGTILINIAYFPQIYKLIKTRDVSGLSIYMYIILMGSGITWCTYAYMLNSWPLFICNIINLIQAIIIFVLIIKSKSNGRKNIY